MLFINGTETQLEGPVSVSGYLEAHGYKESQIAVELNEEILPKAAYAKTMLKDGDVMEIVQFMGGG